MGNITETVTGAAAAATTDIRPEDTAPKDAGAGQDTAGAEQKTADSGGGAEKTYDQAYIDRLLAEQKTAREAAVAEALKVAGMDEGSKEAYKKEQTEKRLAEREADIALRELKAEARDVLAQKDVPSEFLNVLVGKDLNETIANVDAFKKQFDAAVQAQVEKRIAGKTPSGGNGGGAPSEANAIAAEIDKYLR